MTDMNARTEKRLENFRKKRFSLLFTRFFLVIFICLAISITAIQVSSYVNTRYLMDKELDEANLRALSKVQAVMDSLRENTLSALLCLSSEDVTNYFLSCPPEQMNTYRDVNNRIELKTQLQAYTTSNYFFSVYIYSRINQRIIENDHGSADVSYYADRQVVQQAERMSFANNEALYFVRDKHTLYGASPRKCLTMLLNIASGPSRSGLIGVDYDLNTLNELICNARTDTVSDVMMIDAQGLVLLDSGSALLNRPLGDYLPDPQLLSRVLTEGKGALNTQADGKMVRLSWLQSTMDEMRYVQLVPYDHYAVLLDHLVNTTLITLLIGTAAALLLSYMLARYVHRPIKLLTRSVDAPAAIEAPDFLDDDIRYILMKLMTTNEKNLQLEQKNLQQYEALRQAQANVLQAQIAPHFLYNTLQSIHIMVMMETGNSQSPAARAVLTLSSIARSIMEKGVDTVPLADEMDYLKQYLFLKMLSYPDKLHVDIQVPEELGDCWVPKLCLQPLLENAIRYGMRDEGDCHIRISAVGGDGEALTIVMDDNGPGIEEKQMEAFNQLANQEVIFRSQHVGLINLGQRLNLLYGSAARLVLSRSDLGGLRVTFIVPQQESRMGCKE